MDWWGVVVFLCVYEEDENVFQIHYLKTGGVHHTITHEVN